MNRCRVCNNGVMEEQLVETWMCRAGKWVLFRNVPATVCNICGERTFSQEVAERLATMLDSGDSEYPTSFDYVPVFTAPHQWNSRT